MNSLNLNNFYIPLTATEFINRLHICQTAADLHFLRFPDLRPECRSLAEGGKISLNQFIRAIYYPLESYSDVSSSHLLTLCRKIDELFPTATRGQEEQEGLKMLWSKLKSKISASPQPSSSVPAYSIEEFLESSLSHYEEPDQSRLETIVELNAAHLPIQRAETLQAVLHLLLIEEQLLALIQPFVSHVATLNSLYEEYHKGCHSIIRLSVCAEMATIKMTKDVQDSSEWSFLLNLHRFLDIRLDAEDDHIYISFQPIHSSEREVVFKKVNQLKACSQNTQASFLANKFILCDQMRTGANQFFTTLSPLVEFQKELAKFLSRLTQTITQEAEVYTAPAAYYIWYLLNQNLIKQALSSKELPQKVNMKIYQDIQQLCNFLVDKKERQRNLYQLANAQLNQLIQEAPKREKAQLLKCRKNWLELSFQQRLGPNLPDSIYVEQATSTSSSSVSTSSNRDDFLTIHQIQSKKPVSSNKKKSKKKKNHDEFPIAAPPVPKDEDLSLSLKKEIQPQVIESSPLVIENSPVNTIPLLPGQDFPYLYDKRVMRWHEHLFGDPLSPEIFPEYADKPLVYQQRMHVFHMLHPFVDRFLHLAIKSSWSNTSHQRQDTWEVIPAEISFKGRTYRGCISYCTDPETKVCYHKFFSQQFEKTILRGVIRKAFDDQDFPEVHHSLKVSQMSPKPSFYGDQTQRVNCLIDPLFGNVTLIDLNKEITIKLFNTHFQA